MTLWAGLCWLIGGSRGRWSAAANGKAILGRRASGAVACVFRSRESSSAEFFCGYVEERGAGRRMGGRGRAVGSVGGDRGAADRGEDRGALAAVRTGVR